VTAATIPLALGLAGGAYVVMTKITASQTIAIVAAVAVFILLIGFGTPTQWLQPLRARQEISEQFGGSVFGEMV
jgi:hypothetical protein